MAGDQQQPRRCGEVAGVLGLSARIRGQTS